MKGKKVRTCSDANGGKLRIKRESGDVAHVMMMMMMMMMMLSLFMLTPERTQHIHLHNLTLMTP
jgi:hypothetical protein